MAISLDVILDSGSVSWNTDDAANTQKTISISKPSLRTKRFLLVIYNPSTQTDLTCKLISPREFDSSDRNILLQQFTFIKKQTISGTAIDGEEKFFELGFTNSDLNIVLSNDTGGTLTAFTAHYELYEV